MPDKYLSKNVLKESRLQYQSPINELAISYTADVRRWLYLKYAIDPAEKEAGMTPRDIWDEMAQRMDEFKGGRVADIGTGTSAYLVRKLLDRGHRGQIYGFDTSTDNFELMEAVLNEDYAPADIRLQYGDAQKLPLEDNSLDAAASPFLAYHLPRPEKLFSEIHRTVVPGGVAVISGRDEDNTFNLWQIAEMTAQEYNFYMPSIGSFYSHFPLHQLRRTIEEHKGFEFIEYVPQDETIWVPTTKEGWNDYREAIFSLLQLMRTSEGRQPSKTDILHYLERNPEFNIKEHVFESLGAEFNGYFPDHLVQGFVVARVIK